VRRETCTEFWNGNTYRKRTIAVPRNRCNGDINMIVKGEHGTAWARLMWLRFGKKLGLM
jgi:hypothetical protein